MRVSLSRTSLLLKLFKTLLVSSSLLARVLESSLLLSKTSTLVAESSVGDKTLDLGSLISLVTVVFELAANNELGDVVLLGETEELADVGSSLGSKTAGNSSSLVGQSGNILLTLLDNHQVEDADISTNNAATDRLALTFTLHGNTPEPVRHGELYSKTYRQRGEDAHGGCKEHLASWGNLAYRFHL